MSLSFFTRSGVQVQTNTPTYIRADIRKHLVTTNGQCFENNFFIEFFERRYLFIRFFHFFEHQSMKKTKSGFVISENCYCIVFQNNVRNYDLIELTIIKNQFY